MLIILGVNLKSIYAVFSVLVTILLSLFGTIGFMGWMYNITSCDIYNFTILSTSMPIILLTIANSDGVHVLARFRKEVRKNNNVKEAIRISLEKLRIPIFLTSITTAIAFLLRFYLISKAGPIFLSYVAYLIPIFAIIWGYIFLKESINTSTGFGVILILIGVFISQRQTLRFSMNKIAEKSINN